MKKIYFSLLCLIIMVNFMSAHSERSSHYKVAKNFSNDEVIGIIGTGPFGSSPVSVGKYVNTTASFTYSISPVSGATSYYWSVPTGVTILNGQGTTSITVNYKNVLSGAGLIGNIAVQPINGELSVGPVFQMAINKYAPKAPKTLKLYDKNSENPDVAIYDVAKYFGTTTALTLTTDVVPDASFYKWELPMGVSFFPSGTASSSYSNTFIAEPFTTPVATPTVPGTKYWVVTTKVYIYSVNMVPTRVAVSTAVQNIVGGLMNKPYIPFGRVITSDNESILVNFQGTKPAEKMYLGVKAANGVGISSVNNTLAYPDIIANLTSIEGLYDSNYTESPQSTFTFSGYSPSTARLLTLRSYSPNSPSSLVMRNFAVSSTTPINNFSAFRGTTTPLTLTANGVANASFYKWELPAGVNAIPAGAINFGTFTNTFTSEPFVTPTIAPTTPGTKYWVATTTVYIYTVAGKAARVAVSTAVQKVVGGSTVPYTPFGTTITSDLNSILVNFSGVSSSTTQLYFGVKAANGLGLSTINNSNFPDVIAAANIPGLFNPTYTESPVSTFTISGQTASTARLLKLVASPPSLPARVFDVEGTSNGLCAGIPYVYTMTAAEFATSYVITGPVGSIVTTNTNPSNASNTLSTSELSFTVVYPVGFVASTSSPKSIVITSVNEVGNSQFNKVIDLYTNFSGSLGQLTGSHGVTTFCNGGGNQTYTIDPYPGAASYYWNVYNGATIVSGQGTRTVVISFAGATGSQVFLRVGAQNSCGIRSGQKQFVLSNTCAFKPGASSKEIIGNVSDVSPNPTTGIFTLEINGSQGDVVELGIYSSTGVLVMNTKSVILQEGSNNVSEDISSLNAGVYFVQIRNSDGTVVKKIIKQ